MDLLANAPEFVPFIGTLARQQELQEEHAAALRRAGGQEPTAADVRGEDPPLSEPMGLFELIEEPRSNSMPSVTASAPPPPVFQWLYTSYLGGGAYGKTWLAYEQATGHYAAVKIIPLHTDHRRELVIREIQLMTLASRHFSFPQLYQKETVDDHALLFMEYCDAGDLHQEITRRISVGVGFPEHHIRMIMVQLLIGVNYLHRQGYIHRDLKSANVLLSAKGTVKVGDFGLARMASVASTYCGTPEYMAPEIWARMGHYDTKIDVWSLGVILYEMLTLQRPFYSPPVEDESGASLRDQILDNAFPRLSTFPHMAVSFSQDIADICESMLTSDPERRPAVADLLRMDYWRSAVDELCRAMLTTPQLHADMDRVYWCLVHDGVICQHHATSKSPSEVGSQNQVMPVARRSAPESPSGARRLSTAASPEGSGTTSVGMPMFADVVDVAIDPGVAVLEGATRQAVGMARDAAATAEVSSNSPNSTLRPGQQVRLIAFLAECIACEETRSRRHAIEEAFFEQRSLLAMAEHAARMAARAIAIPPSGAPQSSGRAYTNYIAPNFAAPSNNPFAMRQQQRRVEAAFPAASLSVGGSDLSSAAAPLSGRLLPRQVQFPAAPQSYHYQPQPPPPPLPSSPDGGKPNTARRVSNNTLFR